MFRILENIAKSIKRLLNFDFMKKLFFFTAAIVVFSYSFSQTKLAIDEYQLYTLDDREYKLSTWEPFKSLYRTSTWQVEKDNTFVDGSEFSEEFVRKCQGVYPQPPTNFDLKMNHLYEQVLKPTEREAIGEDRLRIALYLDPKSGAVTGTEFIMNTMNNGFVNIPLEKWAQLDRLIMENDFRFAIPELMKDALYSGYTWQKTETGKVERERIFLFLDYTETSNENTDGVLKLPATSSVNGDLSLYSGEPTTFVINSKSKGFKIYFRQSNYDLAKLAETREVTPRDSMKFNFSAISAQLYSLFMTQPRFQGTAILKMTKEEAYEWAEMMKEKDLHIISNLYEPYSHQTGWKGSHRKWSIRDIWTNKP